MSNLTDQAEIEKWKRGTYIVNETGTVLMEDFLGILCQRGRESWWNDGVINMALGLLTNDMDRNDCLFINSNYAATLCAIGLGKYKVNDSDEPLKQSLRDKTKRWIIVPCNDGMLLSHDDFKKEWKDDDKGKKKSDDGNLPTWRPGQGAHWGLLIIDTRKKNAYWFDGILRLETTTKDGRRVTSVSHMFLAGRAAGKLLCGYEQLLNLTPGQFDASTLKWVPHQSKDNVTQHDAGACGPHMYACLKHVYENPTALEDLYAYFRKGSKAPGSFRRGRKAYESMRIRREILERIQTEAERNETRDSMGMRLTPRVMNILGLRISTEAVIRAVKRYHPNGSHSSDDETLDIEVQERLWADAQRNREERDVKIGSDWYVLPNDKDEEFWEHQDEKRQDWPEGVTALPNFARMSEEELGRWEAVHPDIARSKNRHGDKHTDATSRAILQRKFKSTFLKEPDENFREVWIRDRTVFTEGAQYEIPDIRHDMIFAYEREKIALLEKYKQSKSPQPTKPSKPSTPSKPPSSSTTATKPPKTNPPPRTHSRLINHPPNIPTLPTDFANEQEVPPSTLTHWKTANNHHFQAMKLHADTHDLSFRAALQALSGTSFANESDERLRSIWSADGFVFGGEIAEGAVGGLDLVDMRIRLRDAYEGFRGKGEEGKGGADDDDDDDDDDGGGGGGGGGGDDFNEDDFEEEGPNPGPKTGEGGKKRKREDDDDDGGEETGRATKKHRGEELQTRVKGRG